MNTFSRIVVAVASAATCAGGVILVDHDVRSNRALRFEPSAGVGSLSGLEFASADLPRVSFVELEEIVRADLANRFPNSRVELASVKLTRGTASINVVLFPPNRRARAFRYTVARQKKSWKITGSHPLWFVPAAQIVARDLRV